MKITRRNLYYSMLIILLLIGVFFWGEDKIRHGEENKLTMQQQCTQVHDALLRGNDPAALGLINPWTGELCEIIYATDAMDLRSWQLAATGKILILPMIDENSQIIDYKVLGFGKPYFIDHALAGGKSPRIAFASSNKGT